MEDVGSVPFILASASPRRKEILEMTGLAFEVITSDIEEDLSKIKDPEKLAEILAEEKCSHVLNQLSQPCVVIAADTLVFIGDHILGKPKNQYDAIHMLELLSGKTHQVVTAISVCKLPEKKTITKSLTTEVTFQDMDETMIWDYVSKVDTRSFAGGYAIQGQAAMFIRKINGDYLNVVGLPLNLLFEILLEIGYNLLNNQWIDE